MVGAGQQGGQAECWDASGGWGCVGKEHCVGTGLLEGAELSQERAQQEGAPVRKSPHCVYKSVLYICLHSFPANRFIGTIFLDSIFVH